MKLNTIQNYSTVNKLVRHTPKAPFLAVIPAVALGWNFEQTKTNLKKLVPNVDEIFRGKEVEGPNTSKQNSSWMEQSKIIGINPRALGSYFDIVKYAMTFPEDSIHLLPMFEQGCNKSLYAPVNFKLSNEFLDKELAQRGFDTPEKQLKLTINLLHALGKNVGMDFLQHTDRFSEEVFLHPESFTWAKLNNENTKELEYPQIHPDKLGDEVKTEVVKFLRKHGNSKGEKISEIVLSNFYDFNDDKKRELLFGTDIKTKDARRISLMNAIREAHFETKPVNIDNAGRKISFAEMKSENGITWATFTDNMGGKLFGNLAPFKLYHLKENGEFDMSRPNQKTWDYVCDKTLKFQQEYGFDFLRADMGYLFFNDKERDIHTKLKEVIQNNGAKHFATFGECFFGIPDYAQMFVKRKNYDAVLGDLHYKNVNDEDFIAHLKRGNMDPNFKFSNTSITADSDQSRYNQNYDNHQNGLRYFAGLFLNQPSYTGMGLETRDLNSDKYETHTKDYINDWGLGKYEWGKNTEFFKTLTSMRNMYTKIKNTIQNQWHYWLDTSSNKVASWFYYDKETKKPSYAFITNTAKETKDINVQNILDTKACNNLSTNALGLVEIYSSKKTSENTDKPPKLSSQIVMKGNSMNLTNLAPGECRIYKIINPSKK